MHKSVWTDSVKLPEFEQLKGDKKTDVLVIGGGMCGLLCAYLLKKAGVDCIVAEGDRIASGTTKNTTAKITVLHGLIYDRLISSMGREQALKYLTANMNAFDEYERLCENIDCDFEKRPAYTYSVTDRQKIENEVKAINALGFDAEFTTDTELPFKIQGAVCLNNQAQFNPLKFIKGIVKDLNIYEHTFIRDISPSAATSDTGKITANKIIMATHFPFINKHGGYFLKLYQHRSYVCAFENVPKIQGMYKDEDKKGFSLRCYNNLLLIGGESHRTGKQSAAWEGLSRFAGEYYPGAELKYQWAAQDCISLDGVPYIGRYSLKTPNLYVASGFNKWGMTSSMAAAMILCDLVQDKENDLAQVFSPHRSLLKPQLMVNGFEAAVNLLTPTMKRCPHLGCALKWNRAEHTWDCPCHGSRFEETGKLIDNPATGNACINKK